MKKTAPTRGPVEQAVLNAFEVALDAQLRAIRRLKAGEKTPQPNKAKGASQLDLVIDALQRAGKPLHISDIIDRVEKSHGRRLDRESIVSSLVKKVAKGQRFIRTDKNVFALKEDR